MILSFDHGIIKNRNRQLDKKLTILFSKLLDGRKHRVVTRYTGSLIRIQRFSTIARVEDVFTLTRSLVLANCRLGEKR